MALASPAYSFAPCRAAPFTDNKDSFTPLYSDLTELTNLPLINIFSDNSVKVVVRHGVLYIDFVYYTPTAASGTIYTLPQGYRPTERIRVNTVTSGGGIAVIDVYPSGELGIAYTGTNGYINACLSFPVN